MELLIALRIGELNIPNFEGLAEFAKNASKAMEEAQEALKRHTAEHGCCAPLALMHKAAEDNERDPGRAGGKKASVKGGRQVVIDCEKVKALWAQGLNYPVIAERLGISISSVSKILKEPK